MNNKAILCRQSLIGVLIQYNLGLLTEKYLKYKKIVPFIGYQVSRNLIPSAHDKRKSRAYVIEKRFNFRVNLHVFVLNTGLT